ncbi:MAG TPA: metalloregulator ArsR/SmtB family transcription factor [Thermoplasmata archaeon]|jgi:ArsR family transcriptional regulator
MNDVISKLHAEMCKVFSNQYRIQILNQLRHGGMSVGMLAKNLDLPQPLVSQHLAILRQKGVIAPHPEGASTVYEISDSRIVKACDLMREVMIEELEKATKLAKLARKRTKETER